MTKSKYEKVDSAVGSIDHKFNLFTGDNKPMDTITKSHHQQSHRAYVVTTAINRAICTLVRYLARRDVGDPRRVDS